ncbi:MAG: hypothetical protein HZB46_07310 [Solirubrobacterales bacterium]|nr:hypothetical protein [Solirubrobacterales bacterium]
MGRRSRKRADAPLPPRREDRPRPAPAVPRAPDPRARMAEAPKAAWSPFPLTELCILIGMALLTAGFLTDGDRRGVLLVGGMTVVTLAAGELAVREHFAGYRSHSALLAVMCAILAVVPLYFLPVPGILLPVVGVAVGGVAFVQLRKAFVERSGGLGFRA